MKEIMRYGGSSAGVKLDVSQGKGGKRHKSEACSATERRLYALPVLSMRVQENKEELEELECLGVEALRKHSSSMVRLLRPGIRLTPEEVHAAQLAELRARIAADEREVKKMQAALKSISDDPYYMIIELRFFREKSDDAIAERLCCDPTTVRRNRARLIKRLALRLYGVDAMD